MGRPYDQKEWRTFFNLFIKRQTKPIVDLCTGMELLDSIKNFDERTFPHRLLALEPTKDLEFFRFTYSSKFVEEMLYQTQKIQKDHLDARMLFPRDHIRLDGNLFERACYRLLTCPSSHHLSKCADLKKSDREKFKTQELGDQPTASGGLPCKKAKFLPNGKIEWHEHARSFCLPHRKKVNFSELGNDEELFVPLASNYPTVDFISSEGGFNATLKDSHDFKQAGLEKAKEEIKKINPTKAQDFKMYWIVRQDVFDSGKFNITNNSKFVQEVSHFLLPHLEHELTEQELHNDISEALLGELSDFKRKQAEDGSPISEKLNKVISKALAMQTQLTLPKN